MQNDKMNTKANLPSVSVSTDPLGGLIPQEIVSGDIMRGYGPRRGNLERLLRYWRPIMKKPGGFRRCRVILADHPELYPLNNICAWLHHETTGLWPNEGCHHPTMKNCRRKLRGVVNGSIWSDSDFNDRLKRVTRRAAKKDARSSNGIDAAPAYDPFVPVITDDDWDHAWKVMDDFVKMEPVFVKFVCDDNNWEMFDSDV